MAASLDSRFEILRDDLAEAEDAEDYEDPLKACNSILSLAPKDADALRAKCFCLIQLSQYAEALQVAKIIPHKLELERAYCFYRTKNYSEAIKTLENASNVNARSKLILQAQTWYRVRDYDKAAKAYRKLLQKTDDDEELKVNALAAFVMNNFLDDAKKTRVDCAGQRIPRAGL